MLGVTVNTLGVVPVTGPRLSLPDVLDAVQAIAAPLEAARFND